MYTPSLHHSTTPPPNVDIDAKERKASTPRVPSILKPRRKTMKTCLLGVLAGLAICYAWPTFAQQKDPQIAKQRDLLGRSRCTR